MESSVANANGNGRVTYAEVRLTARWLGVFTSRHLAEAMHVHADVGEQFVGALLWQGLALNTEEYVDGPEGPEPVYEMEPLPDTIYRRIKRAPPERVVGYTNVLMRRGMPVRLVDNTQKREEMSMPGARKKWKERERRYAAMVDARKKRSEKDRLKKRSRDEHKSVSELTYAPGSSNG